MRTGTPKSRRPLKSTAKPFTSNSIHSKKEPIKATASSFDFTAHVPPYFAPTKSGKSPSKKSVGKTVTPRHSKRRQVPKSAGHKRRASQADSKKPVHIRNYSAAEAVSVVGKYAFKSRQGVIPGNPGKVNQDAYIACPNLGPSADFTLFGVCDGHGVNGHFVSAFVKQRLPVLISQDAKLELDVKRALNSAILQCNAELKGINLDINFSGTTLILVLIRGKKIWCANVGDSRAVLGRQIKNSQWMAVALSRDHKPDLHEESKRILAAGGRVESYLDEEGESVGPARVWLKHEDVPGLAMSRSLGDGLAASVGVIPTPEILELQLTSEDKFIAIGSDGVFEFISNEEAVKMVIPYWKVNDPEGATDFLERESVCRWNQEEEVIDDITSVCIYLDV